MTGVVTERLDAQGRLQPGDQGWWKVWGASARHVRAGDMVLVKWRDADDVAEYEIAERMDDAVTAPRFRATSGDTFRIGALQPIVLLRQGTHNTLASP